MANSFISEQSDYKVGPRVWHGSGEEMFDKTVLIIDDDDELRNMVGRIFSRAGASVVSAADGMTGLRTLYDERPDVVILDVMMPGIDGWETADQIRKMTDTPIIFLTSRSSDEDHIRGLELGATDYITKPFQPKVLLARVRAAFKSVAKETVAQERLLYQDGRLHIDIEGHRVLVDNEPVSLTRTEFRLLGCLMAAKGAVVSFDDILEQVWGPGYESSNDYVHVYVSRLRRKLEKEPRKPRYLLSVHGVGYRFEGRD